MLATAMLLASVAADNHLGNRGRSYTAHATALRQHLLDGYDKAVVPESARDPHLLRQQVHAWRLAQGLDVSNFELNRTVSYDSFAGTDVAMQVRFFKVDAVDPIHGSMTVKVWLRMYWSDLRLSWDPAEWGNVTELHFNHPLLEEPEIWTPDIMAYNERTSMTDNFVTTVALVQHTGEVLWSRPGMLDLMCKFSGLAKFPWDQLQCGVDFGGWLLSGKSQGIVLRGAGYIFSTQEYTSGTSYQEFAIQDVKVFINANAYLGATDVWPVVHYQLVLYRARFFYVNLLVWPSLVLTFAIFASLWIDPLCGERLGYSITIILAIEVMKVVINEQVPTCGEMLWSDAFSGLNELMSFAVLFETCVVLWLAHYQEDSIFPEWLFILLGWELESTSHKAAKLGVRADDDKPKASEQAGRQPSSRRSVIARAKSLQMAKDSMKKALDGNSVERVPTQSAASVFFQGFRAGDGDSAVDGEMSAGADVHSTSKRPFTRVAGNLLPLRALTPEEAERLMFFEALFFQIDTKHDGFIDNTTVRAVLNFAAYDLSPDRIDELIEAADTHGGDQDKRLVRWEFMELCIEALWHVPVSQLKLSISNYEASINQQRLQNIAMWRKYAEAVDRWAIRIIPATYLVLLTFICNVIFDDSKYTYAVNDDTLLYRTPANACNAPRVLDRHGQCVYEPEMFDGIYQWKLSVRGGWFVAGPLIAIAIVVFAWTWARLTGERLVRARDVARRDLARMKAMLDEKKEDASKKISALSDVASKLSTPKLSSFSPDGKTLSLGAVTFLSKLKRQASAPSTELETPQNTLDAKCSAELSVAESSTAAAGTPTDSNPRALSKPNLNKWSALAQRPAPTCDVHVDAGEEDETHGVHDALEAAHLRSLDDAESAWVMRQAKHYPDRALSSHGMPPNASLGPNGPSKYRRPGAPPMCDTATAATAQRASPSTSHASRSSHSSHSSVGYTSPLPAHVLHNEAQLRTVPPSVAIAMQFSADRHARSEAIKAAHRDAQPTRASSTTQPLATMRMGSGRDEVSERPLAVDFGLGEEGLWDTRRNH